jgi:hypothetical protein
MVKIRRASMQHLPTLLKEGINIAFGDKKSLLEEGREVLFVKGSI